MNTEATFLGAVKSGEAVIDDIEQWVEDWHSGKCKSKTLQEYLGLNKEQYGEWLKDPDSIQRMINDGSKPKIK